MAPRPRIWGDPADWPRVAILVPAYNEEASIAGTLESLLALDYPLDRREVVVMSDASTDRTDEIVRGFESRGVRLVRMPVRTRKERRRESHPAARHVRYRGQHRRDDPHPERRLCDR